MLRPLILCHLIQLKQDRKDNAIGMLAKYCNECSQNTSINNQPQKNKTKQKNLNQTKPIKTQVNLFNAK